MSPWMMGRNLTMDSSLELSVQSSSDLIAQILESTPPVSAAGSVGPCWIGGDLSQVPTYWYDTLDDFLTHGHVPYVCTPQDYCPQNRIRTGPEIQIVSNTETFLAMLISMKSSLYFSYLGLKTF
jgi:hypothetical protein